MNCCCYFLFVTNITFIDNKRKWIPDIVYGFLEQNFSSERGKRVYGSYVAFLLSKGLKLRSRFIS